MEDALPPGSSDVHAFFVRVWIEEGREVGWTGRVKSLLDGAERQVRSFAEIESFILAYVSPEKR